MSDSSRITHQVSPFPAQQPSESSQRPSWFDVVKDAFNPALLFGASPKQQEIAPISPMIPKLLESGDPLCQKPHDVFMNMGPLDPIIFPDIASTSPAVEPQTLDRPRLTNTSNSQIAVIPEQETHPPEPAPVPQILDIPHSTTTPASQIAAIPEQNSIPDEPAPPSQILDIPASNTTPASELADVAEEDPEGHKTAPEQTTPPLSQANTTLDVANRVATKVGAVATVTGTLAKGVDLLPGGANMKQKAMGKIHALYQGIKFPSLSLGKVYQGTKALYQMASSIKSSELIGAAIVCGGLYWWFKRPRRGHQNSSRAQVAPIIHVNVTVQGAPNTIHNNNTVNAPIHVQVPTTTDKPGDVK